jgi:hypothetical protein
MNFLKDLKKYHKFERRNKIMNGFDKLREQMEGQEDSALKEVVNYLLTRTDMEPKYLNEEKSLEGMCHYIKEKAMKNAKNGWNFITNEIVFAWAIMYFSLPNDLLQIKKTTLKTQQSKKESQKTENKQNVISIDEAKKKIEKKKEITQLSLFGGVA